MAGRDNLSENKIEEEEDSLRRVDGLRGRLLAERMASRSATKEADQLGYKLLEMEKLLKEESRSRNRAEKRLKLLIKRLESMDIAQEIKENAKSAKGFTDLQGNNLQITVWNVFDDSSAIDGSSSSNEHNISSSTAEDFSSSADSDKRFNLDDNQMYDESTTNEKRMESSSEEGVNQDDDNEEEDSVDKSMAMIAIEMPKEKEKENIDQKVVDESVKEVLLSLKRAKEQLLSSMERKRTSTSMSMIKVG